MAWRTLGALAPGALRDARVQAHWAAQVVSATADAWLERQPDDGHTNMEWWSGESALVGNASPAGLRIMLALPAFELVAWRAGAVQGRLALTGRTLADALAWADAEAAKAAGGAVRGVVARDYDMPEHAVNAEGAPFSPDRAALLELASWYDDADRLLRALAATEPASTPVRCWPHHFDIGAIAFLSPAGSAGAQIGYGLSPGDHYYEEPYWYLTAWPRRDDANFPALAGGGVWRQGAFTGAVLVGSTLVAAGDAAAQESAARAFFDSAFAGARTGVLAR